MSDEMEVWLQDYPADIQAVARAMRDYIKEVLPDATESLEKGYKMIMYKRSPQAREWVVYLGPYTKHINLGFLYGTSLPDPEGLLVGTGKTLRHIKIKQASDLEQAGVRALIEAAWAQQS